MRLASSGSRAKPLVSVVTPSIPPRARFLAECEASVAAQTFRRFEHLVSVDEDYLGCAVTVNRLARRARGDWLYIVADDDVLLPRCLELLVGAQEESGARIVFSPPLVWGKPAEPFLGVPPNIPSAALIDLDLWHELGGYDEGRRREEDNDLWRRAMAAGVELHRYSDQPTWVYRFHTGNKSFNGGAAS